MTLLRNELEIIPIKQIMGMNLALPYYQRPYRWSAQSTNALFLDTHQAYMDNIKEYRVGSVILHKYNAGYNIVDGQQRLTTLSILLYCLGETQSGLLNEKYDNLSYEVIKQNYQLLKKRLLELSDDEKQAYKNFILYQCTVVKIVTDSEQDAFQFFDSQNSRGKALAPHDLLKSFHLREMIEDTHEQEKVKLIGVWENVDEEELKILFHTYLYPITQWCKGSDGLDYNANKIDVFKGIRTQHTYNYTIYHKASHIFIEQFNANGSNELFSKQAINQFQLNQPLISGKRFFYFVLHYYKQRNAIRSLIHKYHPTDENGHSEFLPNSRSGDIYIKQLYEAVLLFFADRFGIEAITPSVMQVFYTWCYCFRLSMQNVTQAGVNLYAKGIHSRLNEGLDMFVSLSNMRDPGEIRLFVLNHPKLAANNNKKYKAIHEQIAQWNGW